jgi:ABC-2 type transport system permease protein
MVTLDLSGPTAAAPAVRRVWAQATFDARTVLRNGENLLLTLIIPVGVLSLILATPLGGDRSPAEAFVAALSLAVLATAFTSQAISTGFDRRYGVLRMLGLSPLGSRGLLAARTVVSLFIISVQMGILLALTAALAAWWPTDPVAIAQALVIVLLGVWAYTAWALFIAGALRAEATLAVANAIFLVLMVGGGLAISSDALPWAGVTGWLPTGAMVQGMLSPAVAWLPVAVLAAWGLLGSVLASRFFRWEA